jgi:hypothetical protein
MKYYFCLIYFCIFNYAEAQLIIDFKPLTKNQMCEDFDFFYNKVDSVNTRFAIIKQIAGIDILADLQYLRKSIDTISCETNFYDLMYRATLLCKDAHISFSDQYPYDVTDTIFMEKIKVNTRKIFNAYNKYNPSINPFQLFYLDGVYFVPNIYDKDYNLQIQAKARLLEINDIPIDEYIEEWQLQFSHNVRWDMKNKKFYVTNLLPPWRIKQSDLFKITYSRLGETKEIYLNEYKIRFPSNKGVNEPNVFYFDRDKILYIRIPQMNPREIDKYKEELMKNKLNQIEKVIIDVRGNRGGSDVVWKEIISMIINKPIHFQQTLAFRDNELVKSCLVESGIKYTKNDVDDKFLYVERDTFFCLRGESEINPSENSLSYSGAIYVFVDNKCFSSTLAFFSVCQIVEQLVSVGTSTGYFGGQGIAPFYFTLPNSKLLFRVEASLDASNINPNRLEDFYHDKVEIPVYLTIDDMLKLNEYDGEFYKKDFLYNLDPLFKAVLKLP